MLGKHIRPRVAVYTHDTYGLGHIRRSLHIIRKIASEYPGAAILLVTGSPALQSLANLPPGVDFVKIPTLVKTGASGSAPPNLSLGLPEMTEIRSRIIRESVLSFQPDLFLVDNFPLGAQAELLPLLKVLHQTKTRAVLGLRDILDCAEVVQDEWKRHGVYDVIDRYYEKVLIYGEQQIFDAIKEYNIPPNIEKKVHFCGYVTQSGDVSKEAQKIRKDLRIEGPFILATGGGGGDAFPLLSTVIEAAAQIPKSTALLFTGPLMGEQDRKSLASQIEQQPNVICKSFVPDLRAYMKAADVVVCMCGYNIASEIVYHGPKAIVAPRTWRFGEHANKKKNREEKEQILRAHKLAEFGIVDLIEPHDLNTQNLVEKIDKAIQRKISDIKHPINMDGLQTAFQHLKELVECR